MNFAAAAGDEPTSAASKSTAEPDAQKIPTIIAGHYKGGEVVEPQVRGRIAYLIKPTDKVDTQSRWLPAWPPATSSS
jgi:hypothetical protein